MTAQTEKKFVFIVSAAIISCVFATIVAAPSTVERFFTFFFIIFCLACAGFVCFLPGKFTWKIRGIVAAGPFGVFVFVLWLFKPKDKPLGEPYFMMRVIVKKDKLITEELSEGLVILPLGSEPRSAKLGPEHFASFEHIPSVYLNTIVKFGVSFENNYVLKYPDSPYKLERDRQYDLWITLDLKNRIYGTIFDSKGNLIPGVVVSVNNDTTSSNRYGYYSLKLDTADLQDDQEVLYIKKGYRTGHQNIHLRSLGRFNTTLDKQQ